MTRIVWIMWMRSCVCARGCEWACVDRERRGARQGSVTITCVESSVAAVRISDGGQPLFTRLCEAMNEVPSSEARGNQSGGA
jgi:hypothetical protein